MRILFVAAEAYPFAKVGGLGDVAGSLPKALHAMGHEVNLIMPRYRGMDRWRVDLGPYTVPTGEGPEVAALKEGTLVPELPVLMVDQLDYFDREGVYGYEDDGRRFAFFCRAVLEACRHVGFAPDVIHCNDWHAALIPAYLRAFYGQDPLLGRARALFTIHNLQWQGVFPADLLDYLGFPADWATEDLLLHDGRLNFMKAGIAQADALSTVSETYAREIQTPEFGYGLHEVLRSRAHDLHGVVNGLDLETWDPRTDPHLPRGFDPRSAKEKEARKRELRRELGLPAARVPLAGFVGRLFDQKGVDLLLEALPALLGREVQLAILGSGDRAYEEALRAAAEGHGNLAAVLRYDEGLAHRIYAGCDLFLMPSRFEPCGLGQLISMRYGTLPVVRRTGGLADTVRDASDDPDGGTGFVFAEYRAGALLEAVDRALWAYADRRAWDRLRRNATAQDFSWDRSARRYEALYQGLMRSDEG